MKRQICNKICAMLTKITEDDSVLMHYINYEEKIVRSFGVELIGWTYDKFVNPSKLSTSLPGLQKLLDAINSGSCRFIRLTPLQLTEHCQAHQQAIASGSIPVPRMHKPQNDRGTKRKSVDESDKENENSGNAQTMFKKRHTSTVKKKALGQPKSAEMVDSEDSGKESSCHLIDLFLFCVHIISITSHVNVCC
ncbi:hypothetical protein CVT25_005363 [Psilocybe cyanescens]|uniref:Uncharacterized protein n=1 Tax=Psilocybe cyanescens TaxID=93625 RepID=A0A409XRU0_PSICY|nr:hypothetical protein CVT25_005363 [Psilocybe cyanescens]